MASGRPTENLRDVLQRDGSYVENSVIKGRYYMEDVLKLCNQTGSAECWELARMLRDYGARCNDADTNHNRDICEGNTRLVVQAGSGTGDVHQIVGRYPEMDGFSYEVSLGGDKPAELGAAGWTVFVRTVAAGPDRIVFRRTRAADASTPDVQVTASAIYPVTVVGRTYLVTLLGGGQAYLNRELFSHLNPANQVSPSYVRDLLRQGADPNYAENGIPLLLRLINGESRTSGVNGVFTHHSRAEIMGILIDAGARPDALLPSPSDPDQSVTAAFTPTDIPILSGFTVPQQLAELMDPNRQDWYNEQASEYANGILAIYREYLAAIARNSAARRTSVPYNASTWRRDSDPNFPVPDSYYTALEILARTCSNTGGFETPRWHACEELFTSFLERGATCPYLNPVPTSVLAHEERFCRQDAVEANVEHVTVYYASEDQGVIWEYAAPSADTELLFLDYPSELAYRRQLEGYGWRMTVDSSSGVDRFELSLPVLSGARVVDSPNATLIVALNGRPTRRIALNVVKGGAADRAVRISQSPGGIVAAEVSYPTYVVVSANDVTTTLDARSTVCARRGVVPGGDLEEWGVFGGGGGGFGKWRQDLDRGHAGDLCGDSGQRLLCRRLDRELRRAERLPG